MQFSQQMLLILNDCTASIDPLNMRDRLRAQRYIGTVREVGNGQSPPFLYLLRGHLEARIPRDFISIHHLEHASTRVDLYIERCCPRLVQNEYHFAGFGRGREANGRPAVWHLQNDGTPRPTYEYQIQRRLHMTMYGSEEALCQYFCGETPDRSTSKFSRPVFLVRANSVYWDPLQYLEYTTSEASR